MGNSQSISLLTYGVDDSDPVNVNFRNFIDNFTDIDDGLYVEDEELLSIVFNINSKDVVLRSILNMVDDRLGKKAKLSRFVYPRKTTGILFVESVLLVVVMIFLLVVSIPIQEFRRSLGRIFEFHLLFLKKSSWSVKRRIFSLLVTRDLQSLMSSKF